METDGGQVGGWGGSCSSSAFIQQQKPGRKMQMRAKGLNASQESIAALEHLKSEFL